MARDTGIIRTADICDDYADELLVCESPLNDYAGRRHFHGEAMTFATYGDYIYADQDAVIVLTRPVHDL